MGRFGKRMTPYERSLLNILNADGRVVVMTAENRAAIKELIPLVNERFVDVGIAEQTLVGMAAGLALRGNIPVIHALSPFLTMRAFEFIRTDIGIPASPVVMVGYIPGLLSDANGPTHQAIEDVGLMRQIPGMNIFCPSDQSELADALPELVASGKPWYVRYTRVERVEGEDIPPFVLGRPVVLAEGSDVCILTYGLLVRAAIKAARLLNESGLSTRVVNVHTIEPLDGGFIQHCFKTYPLVVVLEDHLRKGGLCSAIGEHLLASNALYGSSSAAYILSLTLGDDWFRPALMHDLLLQTGFTPESIAGSISRTFSKVISYAEPHTF
jgi:transketolase